MHCHIFIIPSVDQEKQQGALEDYIYHMYIIYIYYYIILYSIIYHHMLYIHDEIPSVDQEKQQEALEDLSSQLKPLLGDSGMMDSNLVGSFVPR